MKKPRAERAAKKAAAREKRRLTMMFSETEILEMLAELRGYKESIVHGAAWRLAVTEALKKLPPVGGLKKVDLGAVLRELIDAEYKKITTPREVDSNEVGENEYGQEGIDEQAGEDTDQQEDVVQAVAQEPS